MTWRKTIICLLAVVFPQAPGTSTHAQAPASSEVYLVAYVDIIPASRAAMVSALKQYREVTGRASGDARVETFEQVGRPGHFVVVERWKDQTTLDAHRLTAHAKAFRDAMQPIRVSGYDERPYKALSADPAAQSGSGRTVYVVSHVDIGGGGGQADAPGMLRRLAEASRQESGALRFDVLQHAMRGNHFTVVEVWRDQSALDAHVAASHTRTYRDTLQPISGSPVDERVFAAVE